MKTRSPRSCTDKYQSLLARNELWTESTTEPPQSPSSLEPMLATHLATHPRKVQLNPMLATHPRKAQLNPMLTNHTRTVQLLTNTHPVLMANANGARWKSFCIYRAWSSMKWGNVLQYLAKSKQELQHNVRRSSQSTRVYACWKRRHPL